MRALRRKRWRVPGARPGLSVAAAASRAAGCEAADCASRLRPVRAAREDLARRLVFVRIERRHGGRAATQHQPPPQLAELDGRAPQAAEVEKLALAIGAMIVVH